MLLCLCSALKRVSWHWQAFHSSLKLDEPVKWGHSYFLNHSVKRRCEAVSSKVLVLSSGAGCCCRGEAGTSDCDCVKRAKFAEVCKSSWMGVSDCFTQDKAARVFVLIKVVIVSCWFGNARWYCLQQRMRFNNSGGILEAANTPQAAPFVRNTTG